MLLVVTVAIFSLSMGSGYPAVKSSRLNPSTLKGLFSFSQKEYLPITYDAFLSICVGGIALNGRPT